MWIAVPGVFLAGLGAQVQCQPAEARPSLEGLQAQIDALAPGPLRVFDALGEEIGLLVRFGDSLRVYLESIGASIFLDSEEGFLIVESPGGQVIFEDLNCQGQGFVPQRFVARLTGENGRFFIGRRVPSVDLGLTYQSRFGGACFNDQLSGPINGVVPADEIMLEDLGLSFPLAAPLYVAPGS
jgi:hypothetical protein